MAVAVAPVAVAVAVAGAEVRKVRKVRKAGKVGRAGKVGKVRKVSVKSRQSRRSPQSRDKVSAKSRERIWGPACRPPPEALPWAHNSKPNVVSLFDGIAIGRQALLQLGFQELGGYHAFEISSVPCPFEGEQ